MPGVWRQPRTRSDPASGAATRTAVLLSVSTPLFADRAMARLGHVHRLAPRADVRRCATGPSGARGRAGAAQRAGPRVAGAGPDRAARCTTYSRTESRRSHCTPGRSTFREDLGRRGDARASAAVIRDAGPRGAAPSCGACSGCCGTTETGELRERVRSRRTAMWRALVDGTRHHEDRGSRVRHHGGPEAPRRCRTAAGRTVYRIVQEGHDERGTSTRPGSAADWCGSAARPDAGLDVLVSNPLGFATQPARPGAGLGLVGLAERAELRGGRLERPRRDGPDSSCCDGWIPWGACALPVSRGPARVLVVDDDPLVRSALRLMLGGQPDLEVVGEARRRPRGRATVARAELRPDVVLMDIRMPRARRARRRPAALHARPGPAAGDRADHVRRGRARAWAALGCRGGRVRAQGHPARRRSSRRSARVAAGEPMLSPSVTRHPDPPGARQPGRRPRPTPPGRRRGSTTGPAHRP